ncbi:hypothetical protein [Kitasatospora sp. NPDC091207]
MSENTSFRTRPAAPSTRPFATNRSGESSFVWEIAIWCLTLA